MPSSLWGTFYQRASVFYWRHDGGLAVAEPVVAVMSRLLGWDEAEAQRQIQA